MITKEQNERLTRTGPGTPMGQVLRRYWVPAVMSAEVAKPDSPPVKVKLLSEDLIAFRDTKGRVGIVQERCPHRTASLWLGRNEECGIRCVYHGWKFDVNGECLEMPNEPPQFQFKNRVRLRAYPTVELGDIVWAYMGPPELMPPPPKFEMTQVPPSHRNVSKTWQECNWLQALEGGVDTSHLGFLHHGLSHKTYGAPLSKDDPTSFRQRAQAPIIELDPTEYGYRYAGIRSLGDQGIYVRGYHFVMPWTQIRPTQATTRNLPNGERTPRWQTTIGGHFWVPMDDENCMVWNWDYSYGEEPLDEEERNDSSAGSKHVDPGNYRKKRNIDNDWMIDREVQRTKTYTGIQGVNTQDHAVQESMGPIMDRTQENLGQTDRAIAVMRKLLFEAADAVEAGKSPIGLTESYYKLRGMEKLLPEGKTWREVLLPLMYQREDAQV